MHNTLWTCDCGTVSLTLNPARGTRAVCYCNSCRGFVRHLGADEILDPAGGNDLFQVAPEDATFVSGADKVAYTKMTAKGPARWFATCCNSPLANTLETRAVPFLTLQSAYIADQNTLQDIHIRVFRNMAEGPIPDTKGGQLRLLLSFARRALRSRLTGGWKRNPLFDEQGHLIGARLDLNDINGARSSAR